jgi:hypothetical protein
VRVRIVSYEDLDLWILGKFARRLHENLRLQGVDTDIAKTPDPAADINHHIIYTYYDGKKTSPNSIDTVMITHIDSDQKLDMLRLQLVNADMGICMSNQTLEQLVRLGIPRHKVCLVNPAHDRAIRPRKKLIGITSKVQPTGCKREQMLSDLAAQISGDDFEFFIMGSGWSPIVESMRNQGIEVDYHKDFDESIYLQKLSTFDYYLYLGQDEGSMGFIDALQAGVPTIVTPQGFHLDAPQGITHPFNEIHELVKIFHQIAEEKNRLSRAVEGWTWERYAQNHVTIWNYLLTQKSAQPVSADQMGELRSLRIARGKTLSNLGASFYHGLRLLKNRKRMGAMLRYRLGRYSTSARKHVC